MQKTEYQVYKSPYSHSELTLCKTTPNERGEGSLKDAQDRQYPIRHGIPIFLPTDSLSELESVSKLEYDRMAHFYDNAITWLFGSFCENEDIVRNKMIDHLNLSPNSRVLEVACGTGRDSVYIANRLGEGGEFYLQDISESMLTIAKEKINKHSSPCSKHYFVSSATYLPFEDNYFDALYTFGGFNEFSEPAKTLKEFARVVKPGGKIVFGDENIAPWLDDSEYAKIIKTNNPIFERTVLPLSYLPQNASDVTLRWFIGNCFYLIDLRVSESPPKLNLDLPHKGWRGGSLRTRYFGRLEGVNPETKEAVIKAAKAEGISVHEWLERNLNNLLQTKK